MILLTRRDGEPILVNPGTVLYMEPESRAVIPPVKTDTTRPNWTRITFIGDRELCVRESLEDIRALTLGVPA